MDVYIPAYSTVRTPQAVRRRTLSIPTYRVRRWLWAALWVMATVFVYAVSAIAFLGFMIVEG